MPSPAHLRSSGLQVSTDGSPYMERPPTPRTKERAQHLAAKLMARYNADGHGMLTKEELSALLRDHLMLVAAELTESQWEKCVANVLQRGDRDGDGHWNLDELDRFCQLCLASERQRNAYEIMVLQQLGKKPPLAPTSPLARGSNTDEACDAD
eukprot:CAMPEP_0119310936 /NCGR_PEP_ID=MMETSP1333-20130426/20902_1 /TAXON_ID=418940 /ORGANISM="Scyphosphaera apsteinii, Strain RCC1455" /LENGTH=152 /DNA_ID=CAMNT_0007315205 /DNA_START=39 /DNA_END=497 /DNA_ORIENTATION=-